MIGADFLVLAPFIAVAGGLLVLMIVISFWRHHRLAMLTTVALLLIALVALYASLDGTPRHISHLLVLDGFAALFNALFILAAIVTAVLAYPYLRGRTGLQEEFYILLMCATLGAMTMAAAHHFASFLLGLEILSISLFAMIAYTEEGHAPIEAALKYLVLSGVASTTMLFGMALIYNSTGRLDFAELSEPDLYATAGQMLLLGGAAFKLSLVPFHMWTPDVYQGAPAPVAGYLATVAKGAMFAMILRYVAASNLLQDATMFTIIAVFAVLSMVVGNLLALMQRSVKRILGYSSIAHMGYLLITLLAVNAQAGVGLAIEASMVYLVGYFVITLAAFGIVAVSGSAEFQEADSMERFTGLFWSRPVLASVFTIALLSLAGIPLTMGFIIKFYVFTAGIDSKLWWLIWALVAGSGIGIYYYLRIVYEMTLRESVHDFGPPASAGSLTTVIALGLALIAFGIYPTPLIELVRNIATQFGG